MFIYIHNNRGGVFISYAFIILEMKDHIESFSNTFGTKSRVMLLDALRKSPLSVKQIVKQTSIEQTNVSHNLRFFLDSGIVEMKVVGREHVYYIKKEFKPVVEGVVSSIIAHEALIKKGIVMTALFLLLIKLNMPLDPAVLGHAKSDIIRIVANKMG